MNLYSRQLESLLRNEIIETQNVYRLIYWMKQSRNRGKTDLNVPSLKLMTRFDRSYAESCQTVTFTITAVVTTTNTMLACPILINQIDV